MRLDSDIFAEDSNGDSDEFAKKNPNISLLPNSLPHHIRLLLNERRSPMRLEGLFNQVWTYSSLSVEFFSYFYVI